MRYLLFLPAVLLGLATPAVAQVTVDLRALDALPAMSPGGHPRAPSIRSRAAAPMPATPRAVAETTPGRSARGTMAAPPSVPVKPPPGAQPAQTTAGPTGATSAAQTAGGPTAAARPAQTPAVPAAAATPAQAAAAPAPPVAAPAPNAAVTARAAAAPAVPAAPTMDAAPPPVAQLTPIPPPPASGTPPHPPVAVHAATRAAATQHGVRVIFAPGQAELSPSSSDAIKQLVGSAPTGGTATFNVVAYAAATPDDPSMARRLSLSRALAVRSALMADGVDSSHIYVRALGSQFPEGPPDRVDVTLLGGNQPQ